MVSEPDHYHYYGIRKLINVQGQPTKMCEPKNIAGQTCNIPNLEHYSEEQAWNLLREFDKTLKTLRQNQLNYYKEWLNYLSIFANNVNPITLNILRDQIALLELNCEYIIWYQPNKQIEESQITYYNDSKEEEA